jgi:membrane-associated phospholipid phosphatase
MNIWYFITIAGAPEVWVFVSLGLVLIYFLLKNKMPKSRKEKFKKFLKIYLPSIMITLISIFLIKYLFPIERPCIPCTNGNQENCDLYCPADGSFPSGHAATAFVVFTSLFLVLRKRKFLWIFIIPFIISFSRIILEVHTYMDITVGAVIGITIPLVVNKFLTKKHK